MHTKTIHKIQKAYIKTYEEDVKIYKDIENSRVSQQPGLPGDPLGGRVLYGVGDEYFKISRLYVYIYIYIYL